MSIALFPRVTARSADSRIRLLKLQAQQLFVALDEVKREPSVAAIHRTRVATRRLRAILKALRNEANPVSYAQVRFDLKDLAREFADTRSADVRAKTVSSYIRHFADSDASDRIALLTSLERRASVERKALAKRMLEDSWHQRVSRIDLLLDGGFLLCAARPAEDELRDALMNSIAATRRTVRKQRNSVRGLHKQRIAIKNVRYVCEAIAPVLRLEAANSIAALSKAQSKLGKLHDLSNVIDWAKSAPIPTKLLAHLIEQADDDVLIGRKRYIAVKPKLDRTLKQLKAALEAR